MPACGYMCHFHAWRLWRPDLLELQLQMVVSCLVVLGIEAQSSPRAARAFNHWANSPTPVHFANFILQVFVDEDVFGKVSNILVKKKCIFPVICTFIAYQLVFGFALCFCSPWVRQSNMFNFYFYMCVFLSVQVSVEDERRHHCLVLKEQAVVSCST